MDTRQRRTRKSTQSVRSVVLNRCGNLDQPQDLARAMFVSSRPEAPSPAGHRWPSLRFTSGDDSAEDSRRKGSERPSPNMSQHFKVTDHLYFVRSRSDGTAARHVAE